MDQLPPVSDRRWLHWAARLRALLDRNAVDWDALGCFRELTGVNEMVLRNLLAYLEHDGYAVSFRVERAVLWCGCNGATCHKHVRGCPKQREPSEAPDAKRKR